MLNEIQSRIMQYNRVQLNTTNSEQNTFNQFCIHLQQIFFHSCYLLIFRLQNSAENNYILFPNRTGKNPIINISLILAHINPHLWDQTTFMSLWLYSSINLFCSLYTVTSLGIPHKLNTTTGASCCKHQSCWK